MTVLDHCRRTTCKVTKDATARRVAKILRDEHVGSVFVVDNDRPIGVVTDRDVALRVLALGKDPDAVKAGEIMSVPAYTLPVSAEIGEVARAMRGHGVRRIAIVTPDGKLYGVIAMDDLMIRFGRHFAMLARTVRKEQQNEGRR